MPESIPELLAVAEIGDDKVRNLTKPSCLIRERLNDGWSGYRLRLPSTQKKRPHRCSLLISLVEVSGIEPLTSCMPCKRSPS